MINTNAFKYAAYYKAKEEDEKQKFEEESKLRQLANQERQISQTDRQLELQEARDLATMQKNKSQLDLDNQRLVDETRKLDREKYLETIGQYSTALAIMAANGKEDTEAYKQGQQQLEQMKKSVQSLGLATETEINAKSMSAFEETKNSNLEQNFNTKMLINKKTGEKINGYQWKQLPDDQKALYNDVQATGTVGDLSKTAEDKLRVQFQSVNRFRRTGNKIVSLLEENPNISTLTGAAELLFDNVYNEIEAFNNSVFAGGERELFDINGQELNYKAVSDKLKQSSLDFEGTPEQKAAFNSLMIELAYARALVINGSRPTDQDFIKAYETLTGGSNDAKTIAKIIKMQMQGAEDDYTAYLSTLKDDETKVRYAIKSPEPSAPEPKDVTPQKQNSLNNVGNAKFPNAQAGQEYRVTGKDGIVRVMVKDENGNWSIVREENGNQ